MAVNQVGRGIIFPKNVKCVIKIHEKWMIFS